MHILFVTGEYPPQPGGVGAYTAALRQALRELGCQISVVTGRGATADPQGDAPIYGEIARWDWRIWRQIAQRAAAAQVDWIHVQYQTGAYAMHPAINLAPWFWRRRGYNVAWTYHDLLVPYLFPKAGERLRRWVTLAPAHQSQLVIATNEGDRLALAGQTSNLAKIPIGSNIEGRLSSPTARQQARQARGYDETDLVVGYFGFLNRSKGGLTLVRTLEQLVRAGRKAKLLMIGERVGVNDPTNFAYLQEVEALIATLGLQASVQWTGALADDAVSTALNLCDVLLMPYEDGASLRRGTLMAGLAHGCAIITTTPQSPLPELRNGQELLYIAPGDATAAAQAIITVADDPSLAAALRRNARLASEQFTWANIARQHVDAYGS